MFADRATIIIKSGKGGDGHVSFRREKYVPDGGPDGGDGGRGGDIVFVVDDGLNTLTDYRHRRKFAAQPGEEGGKRNCHGKNGEDLILKVPAGTVIKDAESGKVIADMSGDNRRQVILKGGRGGLGNQHFATSTMQAPRYARCLLVNAIIFLISALFSSAIKLHPYFIIYSNQIQTHTCAQCRHLRFPALLILSKCPVPS